MKAERILYCIFGLFLFAACSGGEDYEQQLEWFEEMNSTDVPLCVDSVQPLVRHYDHWWHSRNHRMRAYYMLGCAYRDQGSAPRALENYQRAVSIADTTDARCDLNVLMRIHSQMSQIFLLQRLPEQEEQELRIAEHLAWQIGDTLSALIFESHICSVLYNKGNYKECINRTSRFHENYSSWGFYNELKLFSVDCVKSYLALKDYVNAKKYLDYYESCPYFNTHPERIIGGIGALFIFKGQYFLGTQVIDSAEYYFKKALPYKHLGDNEMLTYEGLYKTYSLSHKVDSVLKYTSLYSDALTHSFNKAQSEATIQTKSLYDYSIEQQEAKEQTQRASRLTRLLVIAVMLIVLLSVLYLYRNERRKREISELMEANLKGQVEIQQMYERLRLMQEEYDQLKRKNTDETDGFESNAQQRTKDLEAEIGQLRSQIASYQEKARLREKHLKESEAVVHFHALADNRTFPQLPTGKDWNNLIIMYKRLMPYLLVRLQSAGLSQQELRTVLLTHLGFPTNDIALLLNTTSPAISKAKSKANKKLFSSEQTANLAENLKEWG